jgi:HSP20 family protein
MTRQLTTFSRNRDNYNSLISMQGRMNDLFDNFFSDLQIMPSLLDTSNRFPCINVAENDKEVAIKAELPGMDKKDVKIEVHKNQLTISGEKKDERKEENEAYRIREFSYGKFSRSIVLPFEVDSSKAKADFTRGVLTLIIKKPQAEVSQAKTIPIGESKEGK